MKKEDKTIISEGNSVDDSMTLILRGLNQLTDFHVKSFGLNSAESKSFNTMLNSIIYKQLNPLLKKHIR